MSAAARPEAVLLDFSGTLFHIESADDAVSAVLGPDRLGVVPALESWGAINGSSGPADLPEHLRDVWVRRDLSPAAHRAAYSGLARHAGLTEVEARLVYDRGISAAAWSAFEDTVAVLRELRAAGRPTAIVSNIGWDPRPVLARWGAADLVDVLVLSDECGLIKPDPAIFGLACEKLGVVPSAALMIGDNPEADGAASAIGCRFVLVPARPEDRAPGTLLRAVGLPRP